MVVPVVVSGTVVVVKSAGEVRVDARCFVQRLNDATIVIVQQSTMYHELDLAVGETRRA